MDKDEKDLRSEFASASQTVVLLVVTRSRVSEVQLAGDLLTDSFDTSLAFTIVENAVAYLVVTNSILSKRTTGFGERIHGDGGVGLRFMDDWCLVSYFVRRNDGVDAMTVNGLFLDDGLNNVMNMVVDIFVDDGALVNDSALFAGVNLSVLVLLDL